MHFLLWPSSSKMDLSAHPSLCYTFCTMFLSSYHHEIFTVNYHWQKWYPCKRSRSEVTRSHRTKRSSILTQMKHFWTVTQFGFTYSYEMIHKAWSSIEEVLCCFSRSSAKFKFTWDKWIANFDLNWVFPDYNSNFSSTMAMKWLTKLDGA